MKKTLLLLMCIFFSLLCSCEILTIEELEDRDYSFYLEPDYKYDCTEVKKMIIEKFSDSIAPYIDKEANEIICDEEFYRQNIYNGIVPFTPIIVKVSPKEIEKYFHIRLFYVSWVSKVSDDEVLIDYDQNIVYKAPIYGNRLFMLYNNKIYKMETGGNSANSFAIGAYCFTIYGNSMDFKLDYLFQYTHKALSVSHFSFNSKRERLIEYTWDGYCECPEDDRYSYNSDDCYFSIQTNQVTLEYNRVQLPHLPPYIKRRPLYIIKYNNEGKLNYYLVNDDIKLNDYYYDGEYIPTKYISTIKFMKEIIPTDYLDSGNVVYYNYI